MRFLFVFILLATELGAQTFVRMGLTGGPNFNWPVKLESSDGYFGVTRASFQGGLIASLQAGPHFFSKVSVLYNRQSFIARNRSQADSSFDVRYMLHGLEIPLVIGFSGNLGSLRHREFVGASLVNNLSWSAKAEGTGIQEAENSVLPFSKGFSNNPYPVLMAGFEVGSVFNSDAALFFGATFRYGLDNVFTSTIQSANFAPQQVYFGGTGVSIDITWYFPRFSYWFKREFTF